MFKLGFRFLNHEHQFNYRIALEIGLIIALIISCSAIITGLSNQFSVLIQSDSSGPTNYIISQSGTNFDSSQIPIELYDSLNYNYINFKVPFSTRPANLSNGDQLTIFYSLFSALTNSKTDFNLLNGILPTNSSEFLIGQGLASQLGFNDVFPQKMVFFNNNTVYNIIITGIFIDSGPWYFSLLGKLNSTLEPTSSISFIKVQMKNKLVLSAFENEVQSFLKNKNLSTKISFAELKQTDVLSNSFYMQLSNIFQILILFLFVLMALKLVHSSITILNRLRNEFLINKILGMSSIGIQGIFLVNLLITGNIGVILGIFIGITLPQLLMVAINPIFSNHILYLVPNFMDIVWSITISNIIFFLCSFFVYRLKIENFTG